MEGWMCEKAGWWDRGLKADRVRRLNASLGCQHEVPHQGEVKPSHRIPRGREKSRVSGVSSIH
jgi:hypothetical protein